MESDDRAEPESRIGTSQPLSTRVGARASQSLAGAACPRIARSRAVGEDNPLGGKGWLW